MAEVVVPWAREEAEQGEGVLILYYFHHNLISCFLANVTLFQPVVVWFQYDEQSLFPVSRVLAPDLTLSLLSLGLLHPIPVPFLIAWLPDLCFLFLNLLSAPLGLTFLTLVPTGERFP